MKELAKDLQDVLKDFKGCTFETGYVTLIVYPSNNIATPLFAELIFEFALVNSLSYYIGVSLQGHLRFVLYYE